MKVPGGQLTLDEVFAVAAKPDCIPRLARSATSLARDVRVFAGLVIQSVHE